MLLLYLLLFLSVFVAAQESQSMKTLDREMLRNDSRNYLNLKVFGESFLNTVDTFLPVSKSWDNIEGIDNNIYSWLNVKTILSIFKFCMFDVW